MKIVILFIAILTSVWCDARVITVGNSFDYASISEAVNAANKGDTIVIYEGVYREGNIVIKNAMTIIGKGNAILDGEQKYEILTIYADDVHVSGLKLINTGTGSIKDIAAIKVINGKRVTIKNNIFENTFFGVHFSNSSHSHIVNNQFKANGKGEHDIGNGIHLWKCEYITIDNNRVQGHRDGIYFEFVTKSLIINNYSSGNVRYGLHFMFSHEDEYRNNSFVDNGAGVAVMYTKNVKMYNNTFKENWGSASYGLLLKDISDSDVTNNVFLKNTIAIHLEGVSRTKFEKNNFNENGYAIRLQASSDGNTFTKNNFSSNTFDVATNGTMVLNKMSFNYWDKYQGYDLDKDGIGDIPFRPVNIYAMIVERIPSAVLLWRSLLVMLLDRAEKALPVATPENLKDDTPSMKPYDRS